MVQVNKILLAVLLAAATLTGCEKLPLQRTTKYNPKPLDRRQGVDCWTYINGNPSFSTMREAVEICGMQDYYSEDGGYTYLLLDETAFSSYVLKSLGVQDIGDAPVDRMRDILLFHIIKGRYDSYNGALGYDPVFVITLWKNVDAVMTVKLYNDDSKSRNTQDKVTFMDQCGSSTSFRATASDLLMTNGPAHILSRPCVYKK